ncbi:MAG TPA: bifunctional riboflavin kinase/FAD synthetase [Stenomitos sp.]
METVFLHYPSLTLDAPRKPAVVAIGMFDGVHQGHQAVVAKARALATELGLECVVFTFVTHPRTVLRPDTPIPLLTTWDEKSACLAQLGVDRLVGAQFTQSFAELGAEDFVRRILQEQLQARHVVVGYNFAFGHNQSGTIDTLRELGPQCGFDVTVVPPFTADGGPISSSRIRKLLATGHIEDANRLLGRPYSLTGVVVQGDQRGRLLGFPTANLQCDDQKLLPAFGVYAGHARWEGQSNPCVVNLGMRPTFDPPQLRIEAHLLDFTGDLYGRTMTLDLLHRLRPEQAFKGIEALVEQIKADVRRAKELLDLAPVPDRRV